MPKIISGTIAQIMLLLLILPLLMIVMGWIPGGAQMLSDIMVEFFSTIDLFEGWVELMSKNATMEISLIEPEVVISELMDVLADAFLEAMVIGMCVCIAQQATKIVKQNQAGKWVIASGINGLPLLPSFAGVIIGVLLIRYFKATRSETIAALAAGVAVIALLMIAVGMMLGFRHRTGAQNSMYAAIQLSGVLSGAVVSVCVTGAATALRQMTLVAKSGRGIAAVFAWYLILMGLTLFFSAILQLFGGSGD